MTGYAAPDIYHRLHGGSGSGDWQESEGFSGEQQNLQDSINTQVLELNNQMNAAWQGDAATQAVSGAMPLATATDQAGMSLGQAQSAISNQVSAFHTAYNSVVPMASSPPQNNTLNQVETFFGANTDLDKQIAQYQSDGSHNVQVYNTYSAASSENAAAMPTDYGELPTANPDVSVVAPTVAGSGSYGGSSGPSGAYGGGYASNYTGGGSSRYGGSGATPTPNTGAAPEEFVGPGGSGGSTNLSAFPGGEGPGGTATLPIEDGPGFGPGGLPFGTGGPNSEDTTIDGGPFSSGGMNGLGEAGVPGEGGFGGAGGGGAGGAGGASTGGAGSESSAGQSGRAGFGSGNAAAGNPAAAEEAMARAGMTGEPGMGVGGRGRGAKGEEDAEHKTAEYLQEPDPDAIFGTDQMTVPPVIG